MQVHALSYERRVTSQNLEDGIIETMLDHLVDDNKTAIEIGSGDGSENMIRNLVSNLGYRGLGHDLRAARWHHDRYQHHVGLVTVDTVSDIICTWPTLEPDFFSLYIDSTDFWIMKALLKQHMFRPSTICVEYLCYYGPDLMCSARSDLDHYLIHRCGASLAAYQQLMTDHGYKFLTCDSHGVNAFFYLPNRLCSGIEALPRHLWAFFSKYRKYTKIDLADPLLEFDPGKLFA